MNQKVFNNALNHIDADIVENYLIKKEQNQSMNTKRKPMRLAKWGVVVACLSILVVAATVQQYIPQNYNLEYIYTDAEGREVYTASKNVWIYYVDENDRSARERVTLPANPQNLFITWKHLNDIGEDVVLLKCQITSNGEESEITYDGKTIVNYQAGNYFVLNIVVSKNITEYIPKAQYEETFESLKKTFTKYSNIEFDEVNLITE